MHWLQTFYFSLKENDYPLSKEQLVSCLDDYETERFERFAFDHLKLTFGTARWILKNEVAKQLGCDAADVCFQYNSNGKPFLSADNLYVSVAHTEASILVSLSNRLVGIDNELHYRRGEPWQNAESFLNKNVAEELAKMETENERMLGFSRYWTAMEAAVKYKGSTLFKEKCQFGEDIDAMTADGIYRSKEHIYLTKALPNDEQLSLCVDAVPDDIRFFKYQNDSFVASDFFDELLS